MNPFGPFLSRMASIVRSPQESKTCAKLRSTTSIKIKTKRSPSYYKDQFKYWSTSCSVLLPNCILEPTSADEVSMIIKALLENDEKFAVKAGGHNPNRYYSSVNDGPLINLQALNEVTYDSKLGRVRVGSGNRWKNVMKALEPHNVTVVGGRIGNVGVGGYLVGGGLSYLSAQYGWAVDTVVEFEVVLADGTVTTASNTKNVNLFRALRGGGNNYGIVTTYTMKVFPMGPIWAGNMVFNSSKTDQILVAVRNFVEDCNDPKAALIAINHNTFRTRVSTWQLCFFYDGPEPPSGTFDNFKNIGPKMNTCGVTTYAKFLSVFDKGIFIGQVYNIATETSPLPNKDSGLEVMRSYYDYFVSVAAKTAPQVTGLVATMAFQPIPKILAQRAREYGGDLIDLDDSVDRIIMEFDMSNIRPLYAAKIDAALVEIFTGIRDRIQGFIAHKKLPDAYLPLFMNDANYQQDYFGRLRPETLAFARSVREEVDPNGFFRDRTGGFKL